MELTTPRLSLRPFLPSDLEDLHAYASQPEVARGAGWPPHADLEQSRRVLAEHVRAPGLLALVCRDTGRVLGHLGVHPDSEEGRADTRELGFALHPSHQRQGLMSEAVRAVVDYLFSQGVRHIYACCFQWNLPSRALIQSCGFVLEREGTHQGQPSFEYVRHAPEPPGVD